MILDLAADLGFGLAGAYGSKPKVAAFDPVNLTDEQKKSILGNISNFGDLSSLGDMYRKWSLDQNESLLPGYGNLLASGAKGAQSLLDIGQGFLTGELPQDVKDSVYRSSAYKAFSGGFGGSQMGAGLTARDLGLTSLDLIGRGASMIGQGGNSAQQWTSMAKGNTLPIDNYLTTPQQQAQTTTLNNILKQNYLQNLFNVEAAPDPQLVGASKAVGNSLGQITSLAGMLGSSSGGEGGGGGGGSILSLLGMFSDERLKKDIRLVGYSKSGIPIVSFLYNWSPIRYIGTVAQYLLQLGRQDAVVNDNGIYRVRYDLIDVPFVCLN